MSGEAPSLVPSPLRDGPAALDLHSDTNEPATTVSAPLAAVTQVTLIVGGRKFVVSRAVLTAQSAYFRSLLSGRWNNALPDGSWPVDADPDLFAIILRYLRRGTEPLFYDSKKGHDLGRYRALLDEVNYFQIDALEEYLKEERYFQKVRFQYTAEEVEGEYDFLVNTDTDIKLEPVWELKNVYRCPRGIFIHTDYSACGKDCKKKDLLLYDKKQTLKTAVFKKKIIGYNESDDESDDEGKDEGDDEGYDDEEHDEEA